MCRKVGVLLDYIIIKAQPPVGPPAPSFRALPHPLLPLGLLLLLPELLGVRQRFVLFSCDSLIPTQRPMRPRVWVRKAGIRIRKHSQASFHSSRFAVKLSPSLVTCWAPSQESQLSRVARCCELCVSVACVSWMDTCFLASK